MINAALRSAYVGQPYSDERMAVMRFRFEAGCALSAILIEAGYVVFAPIPHSHTIAEYMHPAIRCDHDTWMAQDLPWLEQCERMFVFCLPGWEDSKGLAREIAYAEEHGIDVVYLHPDHQYYRSALARVQQKAAA